ncbi:MAG: tetratricopeptide repeat protein [Alphaproteobacteria bacterium]
MHQAGRLDQAEAVYRQVLKADAGNFPALRMLGFLKAQQGRYDDAITLLNKALKKNPGDTATLAHYAHALTAAQRHDEALAAFDRVLAAQPGNFEALYNRGVILSQMQRPAEAIIALDGALALKPDMALLHFNRGVVLTELQRHREALESYDRALALEPGFGLARANRTMAVLNLCDWDRAAQMMLDGSLGVAPLLTLLGYSGDKQLLRSRAEAVVRERVPQLPPPLWTGQTWRHDRIRIAYVSADMRDHAVAFQLAPVIERHDRTRFQVIGISTGLSDDSAIRARLVKGFDRFHDFGALNSDDIARRLREMEIDIAIDLGGHTGLSRLQIFAHRFAPVQAAWLGFASTTGAPFIDYLIGDAVVTPFDDQPFFSEQLVHLPGCFFPAERGGANGATPSRAEAGLPENGFVFCCFNTAWKITQPVFDIWMRLLTATPGSVLWLKRPAPDTRASLERAAAARGIDPARLVWADEAPLETHLARHRLADLFLDTLPYNAHATAADALVEGLPVLTCRGEAFAGRVAASLLKAAGLDELVTENLSDYESRALELTRDPAALKALKVRLAQAPFDIEGFTRGLEAAYTLMSDRRGAPPQSFSV